jgi:RNA polymerase-binding transcription factor DksA
MKFVAERRAAKSPVFPGLTVQSGPEVHEVKSSEVLRLERYLTFHLAEVLEVLKSAEECDSDPDPDSIWRAKWGSSAIVLKEVLLQSHDEIMSALARMREGSYGNCVRCGNEIDLRRLEVVPWSKLCIECHEESERKQAENGRIDRSRFSAA